MIRAISATASFSQFSKKLNFDVVLWQVHDSAVINPPKDGKSRDLLTMKQNEEEWMEYQSVMEDVIQRSGLDRTIFYDVRGNHDTFGVPEIGGAWDFYSKYSINGLLGRRSNVNSITLQVSFLQLLPSFLLHQ